MDTAYTALATLEDATRAEVRAQNRNGAIARKLEVINGRHVECKVAPYYVSARQELAFRVTWKVDGKVASYVKALAMVVGENQPATR